MFGRPRSRWYSATMSDEVRRMLADPTKSRQLILGVLSGAERFVAGGREFSRKRAATAAKA